jgi:hypothetical protein
MEAYAASAWDVSVAWCLGRLVPSLLERVGGVVDLDFMGSHRETELIAIDK